jgi:competence protein ComEC
MLPAGWWQRLKFHGDWGRFSRLWLQLALASVTASTTAAQSVRVTVIDVGQADALLVRTPNQRFVLIDAGQSPELAERLVDEFDVDRLELVIASHRHTDHVGGLDEVLDTIPVGRLVFDTLEVVGKDHDDDVREAARLDSVPIDRPLGDTLEVDGVRFIILPVERRFNYDEENNNSVIVRVDYGAWSMLFTGDTEKRQRDWLIEHHAELLDVDVLKASHHGSRNGTSQEWLAAVSPRYVVISAGLNRRYKHPHAEAVRAYRAAATPARVLCTNRVGWIQLIGRRTGSTTATVEWPENRSKSCIYNGRHY